MADIKRIGSVHKGKRFKWKVGPVAALSNNGLVGPSSGWFGTGIDGSLVFDGTSTVLGLVPVAGVYTMTQDIYATDLTVAVGVTLKTAGYRLHVAGTLTAPIGASINNDGGDGQIGQSSAGGSAAAGGAGGAPGTLPGGGNGGHSGFNGNGSAAAGVTTTLFPSRSVPAPGGNGGDGGTDPGAMGGTAIPQTGIGPYTIAPMSEGANVSGGPGGGGGGGNAGAGAVGSGGGGGGGGGVVVIIARAIVAGPNVISAKGGAGGAGSISSPAVSAGGGGGGTGGVVIVVTNDAAVPTINSSGGAGGAPAGPSGVAGTAGSSGALIALTATPPAVTPPVVIAEDAVPFEFVVALGEFLATISGCETIYITQYENGDIKTISFSDCP